MSIPRPRRRARAHEAALSLLLLAHCARPELPAPGPTPADALPRSTPPVASYTLRAELDASEHVIHGSGEIRWVNTSARPVQELYLHLYLNAFEGPHTVLYRNPARRARGGAVSRRWGHIQLERIVARQFADAELLPALEPHSPGDPQDATDRRLPLPQPIAPGAALTLDVRWTSVLPELSIRTGFVGDFHFAGQWFPKLARLEPDGEWAHFAFDPLSEFYSDYGNYDVTLDVPEQMVVGATGHLSSESRAPGRRALRYQANSVHDFAWTAWPRFRRREERIAGIDVHLLYPPGYEHDADATVRVLRLALPHYGARYGSYPYADLTVVHPPAEAFEAGGMEYPSLITTVGLWHESYWSRAVEYVTVHELGHQWFYGLLASNERRWPFLDEGLNSYAESVALREFFGTTASATPLGLQLSGEALRRYVMLSRSAPLPIALSATDYESMRDLGSVVYQRTALLFQTLANVYGEAQVAEGLRRYAVRQRFAHPSPDDLLAALAETLPPAALENARQALFDGHGVNYVLARLESAPLEGGLVESRVSVRRDGELQFPVTVALRTAAGEQLTERWDGAEAAHVFRHRGPSPIVSAWIDPDVRVLLDDNLLDNAASAQASVPLAPYERSVAALQWLGGLLAP